MALPEILAPAGTPGFRADGSSIDSRSPYGDVPMQTGHARRRRLRTSAPKVQAVSWRLSAAQMLAVDAWYENTLLAGTRQFAAELFSSLGVPTEWWTAEWVAPYANDPIAGGFWMVSGQLLLTGEPSADGPVSTSAALEFAAALTSTVNAAGSANAVLEFVASLVSTAPARIEFSASLSAVLPSYELREDGGYELREDGGREVRE